MSELAPRAAAEGPGRCLASLARHLVLEESDDPAVAIYEHIPVAKMRYLQFAATLLGTLAPRWRILGYLCAVPRTLVEFAVWAQPLAEHLMPDRRADW